MIRSHLTRLVVYMAVVASTLTICGCSSKHTNLQEDLSNNSVEYFGEVEGNYKSTVENAKQYELNAILCLTGVFDWSPTGQGDCLSEECQKPAGEFSLEALQGYENTVYNVKLDSNFISVDELLNSSISVEYYLESETDLKYIADGNEDSHGNTNRVMQVISVSSRNFTAVQCITWDKDTIVDYSVHRGEF